MLKNNTEAIYSLFEKILQAVGHQEDKQRKVKDVWVLTTMFISSKYFCGNIDKARIFIKDYHCSDMLSKSRFCRRLHKLEELSWTLFHLVGDIVKQCNESGIYCIDTFPVAICHNIRISRSELLEGEAFRGKNASKRVYFYGFKVAIIVDEHGIPVELCFLPASYSDIQALNALPMDLPKGSDLFGDSAFTDYVTEDDYLETQEVKLQICRKKNSKRGDNLIQRTMKKEYRRYIESAFSVITGYFPKKIHAVTLIGFLIKIFFFVFTYTLDNAFLDR